MQLDPRRLAVLLAVHRAGGVLAAAQVLHLTPSAVSQQMARLEAEVGRPLLDRRPTGAQLTDSGRLLADAAARIEIELTETRRSLAALTDDVHGTVTVGALASVVRAVLVPLVPRLVEAHPDLELRVVQAEGADADRQLRRGEIDLLVLEADSPSGRSRPQGTRDVAVLDEPWLMTLPASVPTPSTLAELAHLPWLGVDPTAAAYAATERVLDTFEERPPVGHRYSSYDSATSMVAGGLGVALLPALAVGSLPAETVQVVAVPGTGSRHLVARHRSSRAGSSREVATVVDAIVRACREATQDVTG